MENCFESVFVCPVCRKKLSFDGKSYKCDNGHLYDKSKYGYVNLLMSNKSSSHHGDDSEMIKARSEFLNLGYYENLRNRVAEFASEYCKDGYSISDIGCGEGYYTTEIFNVLSQNHADLKMSGIDISKDALKQAARKNKNIEYAVASAFRLPYDDKSQNMIINMFAPFSFEEYSRISSDECIMIRVFPAEKHLLELKESIYDKVYENEIESFEFENFDMIAKERMNYRIQLKNNEEIMSLFQMTPYSYKTSREDMKKLEQKNYLETQVDFYLTIYRKSDK